MEEQARKERKKKDKYNGFLSGVVSCMTEILPRVLNMDCKWPKLAFCSEIPLFYSFER